MEIHSVSILWFLAPTAGLPAAMLTAWRFLRRRAPADRRRRNEGESWGLPTGVDRYAQLESPFHAWDPRAKTVSLLFYIFCAGALTRLEWAVLAFAISVASTRIARIPLGFVLRRMALLSGFLGMFFVVMPLTVPALPGDVLFSPEGLDFIRVNPRGVAVAALAYFKASAILVMMAALFGTQRFSVTIQALTGLRVPPMIVQMILMCYRYVFVFAGEMRRMATAMKARGFRRRTNLQTLRVIGNFVGVLLVRSFERTERVYDAMLSRGYTGRIRVLEAPPPAAKDLWMGVVWAAAGLALLGLDRLAPWGFP